MIPDDIAATYADSDVRTGITIRQLDDDYILVEGDKAGLTFLSDLIQAVAHASDCGFQISPHAEGSALFSAEATLGIYIHRTPCSHTQSRS
jgi:hypothetical protein